jgi:hypothetical protein
MESKYIVRCRRCFVFITDSLLIVVFVRFVCATRIQYLHELIGSFWRKLPFWEDSVALFGFLWRMISLFSVAGLEGAKWLKHVASGPLYRSFRL